MTILATYHGKPIKTLDELYEIADGKIVRCDGIECTIEVLRPGLPRWSKRHSSTGMTRFSLEPTARGKKTEAYRKTKRQLGDDYSIEPDPEKFFTLLEQIRGLELR